MALIIEDGTVVAGADTFATLAELVTYSDDYGATIPDDDVLLESLLRRAYLQMNSMQWYGCASDRDQTGAWPRIGVERNGYAVAGDSIPALIKKGQMALAVEIYADDLDPPEDRTGAVIAKAVEGAVSIQYAEPTKAKSKAVAGRQSLAFFAGYMLPNNQVKLVRG